MSDWPIVMPCRIERGVLFLNKRNLDEHLKGAKDGPCLFTLERQHATRSLAQNAYYWGVFVKTLCEHTGYTPDEMHELLKAKFLPKKVTLADANGEVQEEIVIGETTTRLNKVTFGDYLRDIHAWASEKLGLDIPAPNSEAA